jgi:hypothetical protein
MAGRPAMSWNDNKLAKFRTTLTSDVCVMPAQVAKKIGISCGVDRKIPEEKSTVETFETWTTTVCLAALVSQISSFW